MATRALLYSTATNTATNVLSTLIIPGLIIQGQRSNVCSKTISYTVASTDDIILCNNATSMTITLPVASATGHVVQVKNINATGSVIVDANVNGGTIDSEIIQTVSSWENMSIIDGASLKWYIL